MMSSEEETTECFGLYGEKLLKKAKRTRQRVDAGEPRNSYSSIPNFSSRPSFMSAGGIYGAIFSPQQQQQFSGLFGPHGSPPPANSCAPNAGANSSSSSGFAPSKMLNELLGRQMKAADAAVGAECLMASAGDDNKLNGGAAFDMDQAAGNDNMLREILQGRKKEILALEQELRAASEAATFSPTNNNNNEIKSEQQGGAAADEVGGASTGSAPNSPGPANAAGEEREVSDDDDDDEMSDADEHKKSKNSADSFHSDSSNISKDDCMDDAKDKASATSEMKRARVENIVSSMRASPSLPVQVNGCKKRKLYHPQQHDSARYGASSAASTSAVDDEAEDDAPPVLKQKRVEKDALKTQLRSMQDQLVEMQQKYAQLCNRMELESDCQDENSTDMEMPTPIREPETNPAAAAAAAAAAMYLGVGHKMFLEQEAQRLKEAAEHHHHQQQQQQQHQAAAAAAAAAAQQHHHQQQQQQQQQHQQQQQQLQQQQQEQQHHMAQQQRQQQQSAPPMAPPPQHHHPCGPPPHHHHAHPHPSSHQLAVAAAAAAAAKNAELHERFPFFRNPAGDLEGLADMLKSEISSSLNLLIDTIVSRYAQQRRFLTGPNKQHAEEQLNKDLLLASQLLDRKSPRTKPSKTTAAALPVNGASPALYPMGPLASPFDQRESPAPPQQQQPAPHPSHRGDLPEQNEALSLVVTAKKKRHKVTDTRITPRTVSRILSQEAPPGTPNSNGGATTPVPSGVAAMMDPKYGLVPSTSASTLSSGCNSPSPRPYHPPPPPMLPVSLPTSVAIPNPSLHESQVFSPYSPFYGQHHSSSPPDRRDAESPLSHPPSLLHPALLAAHGTPDYARLAVGPNSASQADDRGLDQADSPFDGMQPPLSFSNSRLTSPVRDSGKKSIRDYLSLLKQDSMGSLNEPFSSTLTPMHLRKAKLMFFWVRYPSSAVLKMYFPDIKFNKNNTAQLVKWFSNFREFYYIQMEKYARQAITEGVKSAEEIHVALDSEIYRVLNLHYNRNNHIEVWGPQVPSNFRFVIEQTLREFFKAIQGGKDAEQSWKKSIYKVISRLDDPVPEYFKSPNFLEQLE